MNTKMHGIIPVKENTSKILLISKANKTGKLIVKTKCNMCHKHIEKAALAVDGVINARWGNKTGLLILKYKAEETNINSIEQAIADAGHNTPNYKAKMEFYTDMPRCCKYREELDDSGVPK